MIYPFPVDFWNIRKFPLTWSMILINIIIFMVFFVDARQNTSWYRFYTPTNMVMTGRIYHDYVKNLSAEQRLKIPHWVQTLQPKTDDHYYRLASWSLRDALFLDSVKYLPITGDEVAIADWRDDIQNFRRSYYRQLEFHLGLSHVSRNTMSWVTYQFSHAGFLHLFSNMILFLFFGAAVEAMIGAAGMVLLYLFGGFAAGIFFLMLKTHGGAIPMIGASGSICAIMAFYILFEQRRRVRCFIWVPFVPPLTGYIYLPTLWFIPMFLLGDFTQHFSSVEGMGAGVAYTAHMGGTVFGLATAFVCRYLLDVKNNLLAGEIFPQQKVTNPSPEVPWDDE